MQITFLGQGIQQEGMSTGNVLIESFQNTAFSSFTALVAFAGRSGTELLSDYIKGSKAHINQWKVIVGIDLKGTSKEALDSLLELDIDTYIYHTRTAITYHPKIYIFEGKRKSKVIIGSSNLTERGLFNNVEAGLIVDITKPDEEGEKLIQQIKDYFANFLSGKNVNIQPLSNELIAKLQETRLIPTEQERRKLHERQDEEGQSTQDKTMDEIRRRFPSISMQRSPSRRRREESTPRRRERTIEAIEASPETGQPESNIWASKGQLCWKKHDLKSSDAQITRSAKTNPTGVLRLSASGYSEGKNTIDKNTYFRNKLFGLFDWTEKQRTGKPALQQTIVRFRLMIDGDDKGEFNLRLSHDTERIADQNNVPTTLHWGNAINIIRENKVLGKTLHLYEPPEGKSEPFFIDIKGLTKSSKKKQQTIGLADFV